MNKKQPAKTRTKKVTKADKAAAVTMPSGGGRVNNANITKANWKAYRWSEYTMRVGVEKPVRGELYAWMPKTKIIGATAESIIADLKAMGKHQLATQIRQTTLWMIERYQNGYAARTAGRKKFLKQKAKDITAMREDARQAETARKEATAK